MKGVWTSVISVGALQMLEGEGDAGEQEDTVSQMTGWIWQMAARRAKERSLATEFKMSGTACH